MLNHIYLKLQIDEYEVYLAVYGSLTSCGTNDPVIQMNWSTRLR